MGIKNAEFDADFEFVEMFQKNKLFTKNDSKMEFFTLFMHAKIFSLKLSYKCVLEFLSGRRNFVKKGQKCSTLLCILSKS
jgi:hypothetical protein